MDLVNSETGSFLHQFKWLKDNEIGSLDERWNWLEGWTSNHNDKKPYAYIIQEAVHGLMNGKTLSLLVNGTKKKMNI